MRNDVSVKNSTTFENRTGSDKINLGKVEFKWNVRIEIDRAPRSKRDLEIWSF